MPSEVISALIGLLGVIFSAGVSLQLVNWRLKKIEERLDKHNEYAEKFAETTKDIALIQKDIQYIKDFAKKGE